MAEVPAASILITSYNYAGYLPRALESAIGQAAPNIEIVVVDNASTDGSWPIIEAAAARDGRVRAYRNERNLGMVGNHVRALELARAERVLFLSADDYLLPNHLNDVLAAHLAHPEIDYIFTSYIKVDEHDRFTKFLGHLGHLRGPYFGGRNEFADLLTYDCYMCFPTTLLKRDELLAAGGFREGVTAGDLDTYLRLAGHGAQFGFLDSAGVAMRVHDAEISGHERYVKTGRQLLDHIFILEQHLTEANIHLYAGHERSIARLLEAKIHNVRVYPDIAKPLLVEVKPRLDDIAARLSRSAAQASSASRPPMPKISVVLVCGNEIDPALATIQSLVQQQYQNLELVVAAHASPKLLPLLLDRSRALEVRSIEYARDFSWSIYLNDAAHLASGEIITYVEPGVTWPAGHLGRIARDFSEQPIDALVVPLDLSITRDGLEVARFPNFAGSEIANEGAKVGEAVPLSTLSHRSRVFDRVGGFEEGLPHLVGFDFVQRVFASARVGLDADSPLTLRRDINWRHPGIVDPSGYVTCLKAIYDRRPVPADIAVRRNAHFSAVYNELTQIGATPDVSRATAFGWFARGVQSPPAARSHRTRMLVIDDRVPYDALGRGYPRARALASDFQAENIEVIFYPLAIPYDEAPLNAGIEGVEILYGRGRELLSLTLRELLPSIDVLWVSRPHNMDAVRLALGNIPAERSWAMIYDAEAVYAEREAMQVALSGHTIVPEKYAQQLEKELRLTDGCDAVVAVSPFERELIASRFKGPISILPFAIAADPTPASFGERSGLLFVGAIEEDSPNDDALRSFVRDVLPLLAPDQKASMAVRHAGVMASPPLHAYADRIEFLGAVPDLRPVYNAARIFIAPTRFAAGLPQKVYEAAANGVPVVASPLLAKQLGWTDGVELLVPQTPSEWVEALNRLNTDEGLWTSLREAALRRVRAEVDPAVFATKATRLVESVLRASPVAGSGASSD